MNFTEFKEFIKVSFPETTEEQFRLFEKLDPLYKDWNSKINVISRKDIDGLYLHHIVHSLAIAEYLKTQRPDVYDRFVEGDGINVLDLGTGGGFPGIPLAILFPNVNFLLCDSVGKKIIVASGVAEALNLENVATVNARAESLDEEFNFVVSRAVTSLDNFYPWVKGKFTESILYLKGGDIVEEIATMMGKNKMQKGSVKTWKIDRWIDDEYFEGKMVIEIFAK